MAQQRVIVTGAAGQIGSAIVEVLVDRGAQVLAVDVDAAALKKFDGTDAVTTHVADVAVEDDVRGYAERARELWGGVDGFANNAGVEGPVAPLSDYKTEDFDRLVGVNIRGVFLGLKHVLPLVVDGGSVVNTSSSLGLVGAAGLAPYVASKHAVVGFSKSAALEVAPRGVRVNAVCPGPIAGRMIQALEEAAFGDSGTTFASFVPMGRHGTPDEVSRLIAFLLGPDSVYMTGTAHAVDGGFTTA